MSRLRTFAPFAAATLAISLVLATPSTSQAAPPDDRLTPAQEKALALGLQIAPKGSAKAKSSGVNPALANLPDPKSANFSGWRERLRSEGRIRARSAQLAAAQRSAVGRPIPPAAVHDEEEPDGWTGSNDSLANAEPIPTFGTGRRDNPRVRVLGELPDLRPPANAIRPAAEDNGSIPLAANTGINGEDAISTTGTIGDGPHGSAGSGSGDFDFYSVTSTAGRTLHVDTLGSALDTVVFIYDRTGELLALNDDSPGSLNSVLSYQLPVDGTYYVMVAGFGSLSEDPFDSGSGDGVGGEGPYRVTIMAATADVDFYAVDLDKGDVLGATVTGAASALTVYRPDGTQMVGSNQDITFIYPGQSPLPGGGKATLAYVAEESGRYAVKVSAGFGRYDATVEGYRPGAGNQTIFLDFDGARVNTAIAGWGGPGVVQLSPFSAFIARWGLTRADETALVNRITAQVRENIKRDLVERGLNDNIAVRVVNSRNSADNFGATNVSRVVVGGTIAESGVSTIGIAQSIDPGNYAHEETALVLLDLLSDPSGPEWSLNTYMKTSSDRVGFVSQALANVISHEIGHMIGNFHTDNANDQFCLMDAGGVNLQNMFGVGPDGVGGTADDPDVDFVEDDYFAAEGFSGREQTLNVAAWAFVAGGRGIRS